MELVLKRTYAAEGINGDLEWNGTLICHTIELPWKNNERQVSCVPEGRYLMRKRYSRKYQWHLHLVNVPGRDLILVHPANDAKKELKGCIAPVTTLTSAGKGLQSRKAFEKVLQLLQPFFLKKENVYLVITSKK